LAPHTHTHTLKQQIKLGKQGKKQLAIMIREKAQLKKIEFKVLEN
jgi:hypothetical protein